MTGQRTDELAPFGLAVDWVLMSLAGEQVRRNEGWASAVETVYGPEFARIADTAGGAAGAAVASRGVRPDSAMFAACLAAVQVTGEVATAEFGKLLLGAGFLAARLLERLAIATGRDPSELLQELIEQEGAD